MASIPRRYAATFKGVSGEAVVDAGRAQGLADAFTVGFSGSRVQGSGFAVQDLDSEFRGLGSELKGWGFGFRISDFGFRVPSVGCRM